MSVLKQMGQFAVVIVLAMAACLSSSAQPLAPTAPGSPVMTSVTVDAGLTTLTVRGTAFGTSGAVLTLGTVGNLTITSQTNTLVTARLPAGVASGSYLLSLSVGGNSGQFWFTIGVQGPIGPVGPAGPQGPPGPGLSTGTITGMVVSCGTPVAHALVYIPGRSFVAYTGSTGSFTLDYVATGTYSVVAESQSGRASNATVAVSSGQTTNAGSLDVADTSNDVNNCGACGNVCSVANATPACSAGICQVGICTAGFGDCDRNAANGCETNLSTSVNNCGACGHACAAANAASSCTAGQCTIASCNTGFADCDHNAANGCESNLSTDVQNCGTCGVVCSANNATSACSAGACRIAACNPGFGDCDGNASNGCETNLLTSVNNCGACGNVCSVANATPACSAGICQVGPCTAGFGDCDGNASNGCETNLLTSVNNCGACGRACSAPNAVSSCSAGACAIASCNAGFADCDRNAANGCEINISTDRANCGACGRACNAGQSCSAGTCI